MAKIPISIPTMKKISRLLTLSILILLLSCKYYTFTPNLPKYIRDIHIMPFENATFEYGLEIDLTEKVIDKFISDGTLKVVDYSEADAILSGTIKSYRSIPVSYDEYEQVKDYKLMITLSIRFEDKNSREILWEEPSLSDYVHYYSSGSGGGIQTEYEARSELIEKIANDVVRRTIEGWW